MRIWIGCLACLGLVALAGCDNNSGDMDAGGGDMDAGGGGMDGGAMDAAVADGSVVLLDAGMDGGRCTEFTPEYCPRIYPMQPIPADRICEVFADVFCRANGNCCTNDEYVYPAFSMCIAEQTQRCQDMNLRYEFFDLIAGGTIQYSQARAGAEFARNAMLADACEAVDLVDVIMSLYDGQIEALDPTMPCTATAECMGAPLITCQDPIGEGATCRDPVLPGTECDSHEVCHSAGLRCDPTNGCSDRLPLNAGCEDDHDCESLYCEAATCAELTGENMFCVRNIGDRNYPAFRP